MTLTLIWSSKPPGFNARDIQSHLDRDPVRGLSQPEERSLEFYFYVGIGLRIHAPTSAITPSTFRWAFPGQTRENHRRGKLSIYGSSCPRHERVYVDDSCSFRICVWQLQGASSAIATPLLCCCDCMDFSLIMYYFRLMLILLTPIYSLAALLVSTLSSRN